MSQLAGKLLGKSHPGVSADAALRMSVPIALLEHLREKQGSGTEMGKMERWGERVKEAGRACAASKVPEKRGSCALVTL